MKVVNLPWLFCLVALTGCASTMSKIIPIGEPVTPDSCQKLDTYSLGLKDGEEAKREGGRFEFWRSDCAAVHVELEKKKYDEGYTAGLAKYCSCEKGYAAGRNDEMQGLQGQYYACEKKEYASFLRGFNGGQVKFGEIKTSIKKDEELTAEASEFCSKK